MTEGKNGKQLSAEEEMGELEEEGPCPICGCFHDDWCIMKDVMKWRKKEAEEKMKSRICNECGGNSIYDGERWICDECGDIIYDEETAYELEMD